MTMALKAGSHILKQRQMSEELPHLSSGFKIHLNHLIKFYWTSFPITRACFLSFGGVWFHFCLAGVFCLVGFFFFFGTSKAIQGYSQFIMDVQ
jgi:hypothetical protein